MRINALPKGTSASTGFEPGLPDNETTALPTELSRLLKGKHGVEWLIDLFNDILDEGHISSDWFLSTVFSLYKRKETLWP